MLSFSTLTEGEVELNVLSVDSPSQKGILNIIQYQNILSNERIEENKRCSAHSLFRDHFLLCLQGTHQQMFAQTLFFPLAQKRDLLQLSRLGFLSGVPGFEIANSLSLICLTQPILQMLCNVCNNKNNYSYFSCTPKSTVSFRSICMYLLRKKIFLSRMTGWDFFRALNVSCQIQ